MTELELRPERPGRRRRQILRSTGHVVYYVIFAALFAVGLTLGIGSALSTAAPTYWGTFTQQSCEYSRFGCEGVGTWVSDNGMIVKKHIQLDGNVDSSGTVRASYTPTGFNNDAENNIVHTSTWAWAKLWLPWILCLACAGLIALRARQWRRRSNVRLAD